jgi:hypothetical protein
VLLLANDSLVAYSSMVTKFQDEGERLLAGKGLPAVFLQAAILPISVICDLIYLRF